MAKTIGCAAVSRVLCGALVLALAAGSVAQVGTEANGSDQPRAVIVIEPGTIEIIPQRWRNRIEMPPETDRVDIESIDVSVNITGEVASTRMALEVFNPTGRIQESRVTLPVPKGSVVTGFGYDTENQGEFVAEIYEADEAREIYNSIVRQQRDPGLLEFLDNGLIRSNVFPIPAGETVNVWITYEQPMEVADGRLEYVLPRSTAQEMGGAAWNVSARVIGIEGIVEVYSSTHEAESTPMPDGGRLVELSSLEVPGPVRLTVLRSEGDEPAITTTLAPDPQRPGQGYFMVTVAAPKSAADAHAESAVPREVTLVLDRSGSMNGEKFEQAIASAKQIIDGLRTGEFFNIIDYSDSIATFAAGPVEKNGDTTAAAHAYLDSMASGGGTNIHDALIYAVEPEANELTLPVVLFLTDGLATTGITGEVAIREAIAEANHAKRRLFTIGVGYDVNAPLLDALALGSRATSEFVLPGEKVETKVSNVFDRLRGPVLVEPTIVAFDGEGSESTRVVREMEPAVLPDVFAADRMTAIGRYVSEESFSIKLNATTAGGEAFERVVVIDPAQANDDHAYVGRLWANRRIGSLLDRIRLASADGDTSMSEGAKEELIDEIVRLSVEHGVMTEYTSFLATEDMMVAHYDMIDSDGVSLFSGDAPATTIALSYGRAELAELAEELDFRARSSISAVTQSQNAARQGKSDKMAVLNQYQVAPAAGARSNRFGGTGLASQSFAPSEVQISNIQFAANAVMTRYGDVWVDNRILQNVIEQQLDDVLEPSSDAVEPEAVPEEEQAIEPDRTIVFATDEYFELADQLNTEGRIGLLANSGTLFIQLDDQVVRVIEQAEAEPETETNDSEEQTNLNDSDEESDAP
ncbi:MAG: VIT domain-containing protein [Planctomycetota bacterium]